MELRRQAPGDLGCRMLDALQTSFADGFQRAVVMGTDCVALDRAIVCEAFEQLAIADLVVGPAADGGYYLIGMKRAHPLLFEVIPWSTDRVLGATLAKAEAG